MRAKLVLGPPGTGKTSRMMTIVEKAISRGIDPAQIAFVSFTRAAVGEAVARASEQFKLGPRALPYFRTLHSLCFKELGLRRDDVFSRQHQAALGELLGEDLTEMDADAPATGETGGALVYLDQYSRNTGKSLEDAWHEHGAELEWFRLRRFADAYRVYCQDMGLTDFTGMLERYVDDGFQPNVKVAIVDEAQDLTPLQWRVVRRAFRQVDELWIAGDDDQAVYRWSGAAPEELLSLAQQAPTEVLPQSYRLPAAVFHLAQSIVQRIETRNPKSWLPAARPGSVSWLGAPSEVDLSEGTWLLLARTRQHLRQLRDIAQSQGVVYTYRGDSSVDQTTVTAIRGYVTLQNGRSVPGAVAKLVLQALGRDPDGVQDLEEVSPAELNGRSFSAPWHEALWTLSLDQREYYLSCLRRGEKLSDPPRVRIDTIHGAKGMEADSVLLLTDTSRRVNRGMEIDPDSEHRVFYVGATRARERLFLVPPQGVHGYQI